MKSEKKTGLLKLNLQFFSHKKESDLPKQKTSSIQRGIKNKTRQIEFHKSKLKNPKDYVADWNIRDGRYKKGIIKYWKHEINNLKKSIENSKNELKRRK